MRPILFIFGLALLLSALPAPGGALGQAKEDKPEKFLGGGPDAPIRLDIFSDFMCTHCRDFYLNTIPSVLKDYCSLNKVSIVYHEFPLASNVHSRKAARYSLAAQKLGREQWQSVMTELYRQQGIWAWTGDLDEIVDKALSVEDTARLKKLLTDPALEAEIDSDIALGEKNDIEATPTLLVDALGRKQKVTGFVPYPILKEFFDSVVK